MSRTWEGGIGVRSGRFHPRRQGAGRAETSVSTVADALPPAIAFPAGLVETSAAVRARPRLAAGLGLVAAVVVALAIRALFLGTAYDVFVDEVTYYLIGQSVASGHGITLHGQPFFLHPPLFFLVEAPYILLTHPTGLLLEQVLDVRLLDALLGAATSGVLLLLAVRIGGWRLALVAWALFTLDPFIVRINSRNLLESLALLLVLAGYLALLWGSVDRGRVGPVRQLVVGLCFGGALLTKEMTFFLTLLPIGLLFLTGWVLPRRTALRIVLVAAVVYAIYPLGVVLSGLGPLFVTEKLSGLLRFLGIVKTTGFVHGGPSFSAAVVRNLDVFATTYVLMALGIPAAILLAWKGDPRHRVIGVLGLSAYALLAYSIAFGTLEEQFFYFLVLPTILSVPLAWGFALELERRLWAALRGRAARRAPDVGLVRVARVARAGIGAGSVVLPVALLVSLLWSSFVWLEVRLAPDDGYRHVEAYLRRNVAQGTAIGVTTEPQEFILQGYVIRTVSSVPAIRSSGARFVVISTKQIEDGYTPNGQAIYAWLRSRADPVYAFSGRTYGRIEVYRVRIGVASGPAA